MVRQSKERQYIDNFYPDVFKMCNFNRRDLLCRFDAGINNSTFTDFIKNEAESYAEEGNGVSYIICNTKVNEETNRKELTDVVAFYTLQATAIPYNILINHDDGREEEQTWGIPAIEIKMFAVAEKYQNLFFTMGDETQPIAAWVLKNIINEIDEMNVDTVGVKAIMLRSVPEAEEFYLLNGFSYMDDNMAPLHDIDSECREMYHYLRYVNTEYDVDDTEYI